MQDEQDCWFFTFSLGFSVLHQFSFSQTLKLYINLSCTGELQVAWDLWRFTFARNISDSVENTSNILVRSMVDNSYGWFIESHCIQFLCYTEVLIHIGPPLIFKVFRNIKPNWVVWHIIRDFIVCYRWLNLPVSLLNKALCSKHSVDVDFQQNNLQ